ncbi:hypothetical protein BH10BAC5_BH10BAC5_11570 [soil metagenome]
MKILIVCSGNSRLGMPVFVREHAENLQRHGVEIEYFLIKGKGLKSYYRHINLLKNHLFESDIDIVHAFFGLSGLVCTFQKTTPTVVSFVGCDINIPWQRTVSKVFVIPKTKRNIFVSEKLFDLAGNPKNSIVLPFGVDLTKYKLKSRNEARIKLGWSQTKKYILFASTFDRVEKNPQLAFAAVKLLTRNDIELVEFKNIKDDEIADHYAASDLLLLTSIREGSPQVIKEAMAMNTPIVSTDVGDVKAMIGNMEGCYITSFDPQDVAEKIAKALDFGKNTNTRTELKALDNNYITEKIIGLYNNIVDIEKSNTLKR